MSKKQSFRIIGMTCSTCAKNVEKALNKIEEIQYVSVNLATEKGFVVSENDIDFEMIKNTVNSIGYDVSQNFDEDLYRPGIQKEKEQPYSFSRIYNTTVDYDDIAHAIGSHTFIRLF